MSVNKADSVAIFRYFVNFNRDLLENQLACRVCFDDKYRLKRAALEDVEIAKYGNTAHILRYNFWDKGKGGLIDPAYSTSWTKFLHSCCIMLFRLRNELKLA